MSNPTHTSIHSYNADKGLGFFQKLFYLFLNWLNNLLPYTDLDQRLEIRNFEPADWKTGIEMTYETSSVGRRFSDLFWYSLPWDKIKEELGEIHIFDTGCGSGNYGVRLMDASGGRISSYTGIDAKEKPNWEDLRNQYSNFTLIRSGSSDIRRLIPLKANFFITQSAIEHFDEDLVFFEQIKEFINKTDKPVIQIHNFPGAAILPLYLFHGIRQYTPRTVSKITRLFNGNERIYLYGLGGKAGKKVHWKYFTWPLLVLRKKAKWSENTSKYDHDVRKAMEYDLMHPIKSPIFWVLVIHSHPKIKVW